jgi:hypothetical protein
MKNQKRVVDWIKYKNIKDNSLNNSALEGLSRRNKILKGIIKSMFVFTILGYNGYNYINEFNYLIKDSGKNFLKNLNNSANKKLIFKDSHKLQCLEYLDNKVNI